MKNRKIVAIVGLAGSGKTEAIEYLRQKYQLPKVYFGDVTFDELKARNLEINEKNERQVREDLRAKYGDDIYCRRVIEKIKKLGKNQTVLVESLYSWPEYQGFIEEFKNQFIVVAIYSPPAVRYERLAKRPIRPLTKDEARGRDYAQIKNLSQAGPIAMADYTIENIGTLKNLQKNLDKVWGEINAK